MRSSRGTRSSSSSRQRSATSLAVTAAAYKTSIEALEGRRMLASSPYAVGRTPVYTASSSNVYDVKDGPLAKGGEALVNIYKEYQKYVKGGGARSKFVSSYAKQYVVQNNKVGVLLRTRGSVDDLIALIKANGGTVTHKSKADKIVQAMVPINQADNIAENRNLMHIRPLLRPFVNSVGVGVNEAEKALKTDSVATGFDVDGSGQTVGVISDSFNLLGGAGIDAQNGDLPSDVNVLRDDAPGNDEGRAMAQLIHDVAPGADLAFSTAGYSQLDFADSIRNLREEAGSTVIVDDIGFFEEPFFQPGVIDQAIDDVTDDGVNYFSAAGNSAFSGYQRKADYVSDPNNVGGFLVDFDPGKGVDTRLDITISNTNAALPSRLFFQWDDAYNGVVGNVRADMDIFLYRKGAVVASSIDNNFATGVPTERFDVIEPGDYQIVIRVNRLQKGGELPGYYKFTGYGTGGDPFDARAVEHIVDNTTISSPFGHSLTRNGISVGAVPARATEAFGQFKDFENEEFSSAGSGLDLFDENGNRLENPIQRVGALFSSVDGVTTKATNTTLFDPFFGTSAAAPNAAALAALLRQMHPDADQEQVRQAMIDSAKQHPLNGTEAGKFDPQGGWGLIDGVLAASRLDSTIPTARIDVPAVSDGVGSITVRFSEPVSGVDISDFLLTRDGTNVNRFKGNETVTDTGDGKTFIINNLKSATKTLGTYTIRLRNSGTEIEDSGGHQSLGQYTSFDVTLHPVGNLSVQQLGDGNIKLHFVDTNHGEDSYRIERATNPDFTKNVRKFELSANSTSFSDSAIEPATAYYYRIRGERGGKLGNTATVSVYNGSEGEIFLDQANAKFSGQWTKDQASSDAFLSTYASASPTGTLKADKANTATFTADLAKGSYLAYVQYVERKSNATNTLVEVIADGKTLYTARLNQTKRGGGWVLLDNIVNKTSGNVSVRISSKGADGNVVADAVRFLPADEATATAAAAQIASTSSKKSSRKSVASSVNL